MGNQFEGMLSGGDTWVFAYIPSQYADEDFKTSEASRGSEMLMISKEELILFLKIYFAYWDYCED